jgi:hypothetical protein
LFPNSQWKEDFEFQNDSLTYILFHEKNNIQSQFGTNHWIPFTENEVNAQAKFESSFMTDFMKGKIKIEASTVTFFDNANGTESKPLAFSDEAKAVFDAGRKLWKYYHAQKGVNVNASLYDIREYFQGRNAQGRMNSKSTDERYSELISELRIKLNLLADKLKPKIYEHGFLQE